MNFRTSKAAGHGLFGEKYEEDVRVVSMGEFPWNVAAKLMSSSNR